jgi:zinc protease
LMAKMVRKPSFNKTALDAERKIVQGELERRASDPEFLLYFESDQLLWGDRAWDYKSAGGNVPALNAATPKQLTDIYNRFYVPNNAALVIAGDFADSAVVAWATKQFGNWKRGPDPLAAMKPVVIAPLTTVKRKVQTAEVKDVTFFVRWQGPSVAADPAGTVTARAFGGLVNQAVSKTQRRLVDGGLFDELRVGYEVQRNVGPITMTARTTADRAVAAARALNEELARIIAPDYFDDADLVLAKKWQEVTGYFMLESALGAATEIAGVWSAAGLDHYLDRMDRLNAQGAADVRRFMSTYIAGKPMAVLVLLPQNEWLKIGTDMQRALGAWKTP